MTFIPASYITVKAWQVASFCQLFFFLMYRLRVWLLEVYLQQGCGDRAQEEVISYSPCPSAKPKTSLTREKGARVDSQLDKMFLELKLEHCPQP